jgi:uncharacterized membrane protein
MVKKQGVKMLRKLGDITLIELILIAGIIAGIWFFGKTFIAILVLAVIILAIFIWEPERRYNENKRTKRNYFDN